jgi:hypothetical protein
VSRRRPNFEVWELACRDARAPLFPTHTRIWSVAARDASAAARLCKKVIPESVTYKIERVRPLLVAKKRKRR